MCYKKSKLYLYPLGYVSMDDLQRVKNLINQADKSKLQTEYKNVLRLFDSDDNSNLVTELQCIEHETNAKRKKWLKEVDTMYKHYTVNKSVDDYRLDAYGYAMTEICVGNGTHKLKAETNPIREIYTKWNKEQEESMKSNIKYYTSLEMVEKIKNGFGKKMDDGSVTFKSELGSTLLRFIGDIKYYKGNFYYTRFCKEPTLLPIDVKFGINEPVFKPIQPEFVHIDFHGVIIPVKKSSITGKKFIACDNSGTVMVYDHYPTPGTDYFLSKSHGKCKIIANIEYEGDWKQSCTEIKLVEVE